MAHPDNWEDRILRACRSTQLVQSAEGLAENLEAFQYLARAYAALDESERREFERALQKCLTVLTSALLDTPGESRNSESLCQLLLLCCYTTPQAAQRLELIQQVLFVLLRLKNDRDGEAIYRCLQALLSQRFRGSPEFWLRFHRVGDAPLAACLITALARTGHTNLLNWVRGIEWAPYVTEATCNSLPAIYEEHGPETSARFALIALSRSRGPERVRLEGVCRLLHVDPDNASTEAAAEELAVYLEQFIEIYRDTFVELEAVRKEVAGLKALVDKRRRGLLDIAIERVATRWKNLAEETVYYTYGVLQLVRTARSLPPLVAALQIGVLLLDEQAPPHYRSQRERLVEPIIKALGENPSVARTTAQSEGRTVRQLALTLLRAGSIQPELTMQCLCAMPGVVSIDEFVRASSDALGRSTVAISDWIGLIKEEYDREDAVRIARETLRAYLRAASQGESFDRFMRLSHALREHELLPDDVDPQDAQRELDVLRYRPQEINSGFQRLGKSKQRKSP